MKSEKLKSFTRMVISNVRTQMSSVKLNSNNSNVAFICTSFFQQLFIFSSYLNDILRCQMLLPVSSPEDKQKFSHKSRHQFFMVKIKNKITRQICYDSTYIRYHEQSNEQRQKVEQWLGAGGERRMRNYCLMDAVF